MSLNSIFNQSDLSLGNLEVRLASSEAEIDASMALRYRVFYEEMAAQPTEEMLGKKRDFDPLDQYCDHLLVVDKSIPAGENNVIGTYRLIRREAAARNGGFYSRNEFDITRIVEYPGEVLELGRSCIDAKYRTGSTMQLLWRGLAAYVFAYKVQLLFGCASLPG